MRHYISPQHCNAAQRYETLNDSDESGKTFTRSNSLHDLNIDKQKIGYFTVQTGRRAGGPGESSSTAQSDDEVSNLSLTLISIPFSGFDYPTV